MVKRFLGKAISKGTVMTILKDFGDKCLSLIPVVRNYLSFSPVKNADETGMKVDGMLHWLHTVCNDKATYLYADKKRGFDAISNDGLLIDATGVLIHDCWSSYFRLENLEHAICLQHIQRELRGAMIREKDKASYFQEIEDFLLEMRKLKLDAIEAGVTCVNDEVIECLRLR